MTLVPGQNFGMVLDNDFASFSTTYDVSYTVKDATIGAVLSSSATVATTPPCVIKTFSC